MLKKNDIIDAHITAMSSDGNGIAKIDHFVVFVPYSAVGDHLRIRIVKVQKSFGFGKIEEILEPASTRCQPDCPVYQKCGGCSFRHITYEQELCHKAEFVRDTLQRIGGLNIEPEAIVGSPLVNGYRNKAQYPVRLENGKVLAGFFAKRSHRVIPCAGCALQPAFYKGIIEYTQTFAEEKGISIYDEESGKGLLRHIYLRYGEVSGQVMVCLVLNGTKLPHADDYVKGLLELCPSVASVVLNVNKRQDNVILGEQCITLYGSDTIEDTLCDVSFHLSPLSFYQVNRQAAQQLYRLAADMADLKGEELLVDLYCGAGTIGLSMAKRVRQLVGVEIIPDAVENARENAKNCGIHNARFLCADAGEAAQMLAAEGLKPDVIVVDPPRKGCSSDVLEAIQTMSPDKLIYISCNVASLARDAKELEQLGYHAARAIPVDLFPRTAHVETVVLLSKGEVDSKKIRVEFSLEDMDMSEFQDGATYTQIKDYVLEHNGLKVSNLYISQIKRK
ncbi:MAG: 23S rRNA (uracil(1939)-C(5))-methyltransferase RlmD, partial [Oscillospiraceae bacterium]|nr:23S rRNA (uracil(1939)-C(5))-methyltransferase RlmD [Oscillospiraceae bacterium]